jgi:hypothetical protein
VAKRFGGGSTGSDIGRGHIGHPARQYRDRRHPRERLVDQQLGQNRLNRAVAAIGDDHADTLAGEVIQRLRQSVDPGQACVQHLGGVGER